MDNIRNARNASVKNEFKYEKCIPHLNSSYGYWV